MGLGDGRERTRNRGREAPKETGSRTCLQVPCKVGTAAHGAPRRRGRGVAPGRLARTSASPLDQIRSPEMDARPNSVASPQRGTGLRTPEPGRDRQQSRHLPWIGAGGPPPAPFWYRMSRITGTMRRGGGTVHPLPGTWPRFTEGEEAPSMGIRTSRAVRFALLILLTLPGAAPLQAQGTPGLDPGRLELTRDDLGPPPGAGGGRELAGLQPADPGGGPPGHLRGP